jgi:hypothetical protein
MSLPAFNKSVCVFCGSSKGNRPEFVESGKALGTEIARRGMRLVYGMQINIEFNYLLTSCPCDPIHFTNK